MKLTFTENAIQRLEKLGMIEDLSLHMSTIYGCGGPDSSMFTIRAYDAENLNYDTFLDSNFGKIKVKKSISLERECSVNMRTFKNRKIKVKNFFSTLLT